MPSEAEYELKFRIGADSVEPILEHPLVRDAAANRRVERLVSTYFDTTDGLLHAHHFALRVRAGGRNTVHTLKLTRDSSVRRGEWEQISEARQPDMAWLRRTPLGPFLPGSATDLVPQFTVDVERIVVPITYRGTTIEIAIDRGVIRASGRTLPFSEVELELKEGRFDALMQLARRLVADLPMILSFSSKSERGYALAADQVNEPVHKIRPRLARGMSVAQAFDVTIETCLRVFLKNLGLIGAPDDVEAVHRARTSLRHVRAAFELFRPELRRKRLAAIESKVKHLSRAFGAVRDRDVFQHDVFAPLAESRAVPGARALAKSMEADRRHAHDDLSAFLATRAVRLALLDLLAFASDGVRRRRRGQPFEAVVRGNLQQARIALAGKAVRLARRSTEEMHKIRKSSKTLRYEFDLVRSVRKLRRNGRAKAWRRHLGILQDCLGAIHDDQAMRSHVANQVLARFASAPPERDGRAALAAGVYLCFRPVDRGKNLRKAKKAACWLRDAC